MSTSTPSPAPNGQASTIRQAHLLLEGLIKVVSIPINFQAWCTIHAVHIPNIMLLTGEMRIEFPQWEAENAARFTAAGIPPQDPNAGQQGLSQQNRALLRAGGRDGELLRDLLWMRSARERTNRMEEDEFMRRLAEEDLGGGEGSDDSEEGRGVNLEWEGEDATEGEDVDSEEEGEESD